MAGNDVKATDEGQGNLAGQEGQGRYERMLACLGEERRRPVVEGLREAVLDQCEDALSDESEAYAIEKWRKAHPHNRKKDRQIRKTPEYAELLAEIEATRKSEEEVSCIREAASSADTLDELIELAKSFRYTKPCLGSLVEVLDRILAEEFDAAWETGLRDRVIGRVEEHVAEALSSVDLEDYYWDHHYDNYYRRHPRIDYYEIRSAADLDELVALDDGDGLVYRVMGEETANGFWDSCVPEHIDDEFKSSGIAHAIEGFASDLFGSHDSMLCPDEYLEHRAEAEIDVPGAVAARFPERRLRELIYSNPRYKGILQEERKRRERTAAMERDIVDRIPENPIDLFPVARSMSRHFVLHVGPTNSGKTHDAIAALGKAASGCYLAPLRLLAYEQYESLNEGGCPCSLLTGEEEMSVKGSRHVASTIEMADFSSPVDIAVIDEAQMLADPDRGSHWTDAILGIPASEVHVCLAPEARDIVERLAAECGDTCEIIEHERMTPLEHEGGSFSFPNDVRKGDALIVFTRRAVQGVAAQLAMEGKSASMIYGALPYDVRHREAARFASGETDVVVATDAIGMGMNLPIRRIVFLEQAKFDGHEKRFLNAGEVRQIAGRAGRYGIYDKGLWKSANATRQMRKLMSAKVTPLSSAPLGFVRSLLGVDGTVSELLDRWSHMGVDAPFAKYGLERETELAESLEEIAEGVGGPESLGDLSTKQLIYRFATLPFKEQVPGLLATWAEMFECELDGTEFPVKVPSGPLPHDMDSLESQYAYTDLLHQYCRAFGRGECYEEIDARRREISDRISEMIARSVFEKRTCRHCGKPLPWNWPYPMCDPCHDRMYGRYRDDWYY